MEGSHLDPAAFHGFVSGTLTPEEREAAVTHLDGCSRCRRLLSALMSDLGDGDETMDPSGAVTLQGTPAKGAAAVTAPDLRHLMKTEQSGAVTRHVAPLDVAKPTPSDQLKGQKLGDYLVQDLIATGGMGAVYKGVQPLIGKQVAIKVLISPGPVELNYAQRMLEEARAVNSIGHPNIIDIFNFGELPDGRPWLVMEYLDGLSLSQWVRSRGPELHTAKAVAVLEQIAAALEAVHSVGIVHRDLKPANVMMTQLSSAQPRVKVLDFGFAKTPETALRTSPDLVLGTPGYMSPEQIQSQPATPRSDLYSMGLLGYFMVTGGDPYSAPNPVQVMHAQLKAEPPSLKGHPAVTDDLAELIADLTRIDPSKRPASAKDVRERLKSIATGLLPPRVSDAVTIRESDRILPAPRVRERQSAPPNTPAVQAEPRRRRSVPQPVVEAPKNRSWVWLVLAVAAIGLGITAAWFAGLLK